MKNVSRTHLFSLQNIILALILLLISARFVIAGWDRILKNANSADGDQAAYLQLGLDVREHGLITDGKRNPLYPLLLAPLAERDWRYFTRAKLLNLGLGLVTIWAVYWAGARLYNRAAGLLAAFLLSINIEFILHSTFALAESGLILCAFLSWYFMVRSLQTPNKIIYWAMAGVWAGLAYLAKGTGPIFVFCFVVTAALLYTPGLWKRRGIWIFLLSFVIVSLPLWLYNWYAFGSPLFNSAITNVMWMDSATEKYVADPSTLPTLSTYLQNNNPGEAWLRLREGLLAMRYFFLRVLWPTRSVAFDEAFQNGFYDLIGALLILTSLIFWRYLKPIVKANRESLLLTATIVIVFYVLFGWYLAIAPFPIRFLLPIAPTLILLFSAAVISLFRRLHAYPAAPRWARPAATGIVTLLLVWAGGWSSVTGWYIARNAWQNPFAADAKYNDYSDQALVWVQTGHTKDQPVTVMWGPSHVVPTWRHSDFLQFIRTPAAQVDTIDRFSAFLNSNEISYIVVDREMLDRVEKNITSKLGFERQEEELLDIKSFPPDWALGFASPGLPCQWCVFRRVSAAPSITHVDYLFDNTVRLYGYEIEPSQFYPGGQLVVTLHWQAIGPATVDYTIFTQLLGPDYLLHGQLDKQPLSGLWPTSRWQPDQRFVDKFVIDVSEDAPAGAYVLLVGLYDLNTGQRAPVLLDGQLIPDNAIPLHHLSLQVQPQYRR